MSDADLPPRPPVPIEELATELRRLFVRLGGDRTDTSAAMWTRQSPEEWEANLARFDQVLVAACTAVGLDAPGVADDGLLPGPAREAAMDALAQAGMDVRQG